MRSGFWWLHNTIFSWLLDWTSILLLLFCIVYTNVYVLNIILQLLLSLYYLQGFPHINVYFSSFRLISLLCQSKKKVSWAAHNTFTRINKLLKRILHVHHELKHYSCETNSNSNNNNNKIKILLILLCCVHIQNEHKFMALILILWLYSLQFQPMFNNKY